MNSDLIKNPDYKDWLKTIKNRVYQVQLAASRSVNQTLIQFYWDFGNELVEKQEKNYWGTGFIKRTSLDLTREFPDIKGFSERNLTYIRKWVLFWSEQSEKGQQLVAQLAKLPWGHNLLLISKCASQSEALFYLRQATTNGWSRNVLTHQIESGLWVREGQAVSNFKDTLPQPQSDLANQTLKDPYIFDFLTLTKGHSERELEQGLVEHITKFLLELGAGFSYMGRQIRLEVGEREIFLDLLFYHVKLHCYIVIELKTGDFEPEYAGKLNFYIKAVDEKFRQAGDESTIGILLCKNRDKIVAEYALSDIHKPIGVSEYQLTQSLPEKLKSSLPSIEEIENELSRGLEGEDV